MGSLTDKYCIVGVGETPHMRPSNRTTLSMACEAVSKALADAGLKPGDIDGMTSYQAGDFTTSPHVATALRMRLNYAVDILGGGSSGEALVAHGGGLLLPTGIAMVTGLGVAIALGVTSKKILAMVWPTTDANRAKVEAARAEIARIIQDIVPLDTASRAKLAAAGAHAHTLGERYLEYLGADRAALERNNHLGADELAGLLDLDSPVIR